MKTIIDYPYIRDAGRIPVAECGELLTLIHDLVSKVSLGVLLPTDQTEYLVLHAEVYRGGNGKPKAYCEISRVLQGTLRPKLFASGGEVVIALATNINITVEDGVAVKFGHEVPYILECLQKVK